MTTRTPSSGANGRPIVLTGAAGGRGGSWYVLLEGIAALIADVHPAIRIEVVEGGGVINHERVGRGDWALAILNPPMLDAARHGRPPFDRAYRDLRVGVANLTVNHLHFMVVADSPLTAIGDWPATRTPLRIPVDRVGTVDRLVFDRLLDDLGITPDRLAAWGGALIPAANYDEQLALYRAGRVDALWQFMGIPSPSIAAAQAHRPLRPLALPPGLIADLVERGWEMGAIPAGAYGAAAAPVPTVTMGTTLGFHAAVPDAIVAAIVGAINDYPERIRAIHPAAAAFDPRRGLEAVGAPLHPGAVADYDRRGWLG